MIFLLVKYWTSFATLIYTLVCPFITCSHLSVIGLCRYTITQLLGSQQYLTMVSLSILSNIHCFPLPKPSTKANLQSQTKGTAKSSFMRTLNPWRLNLGLPATLNRNGHRLRLSKSKKRNSLGETPRETETNAKRPRLQALLPGWLRNPH